MMRRCRDCVAKHLGSCRDYCYDERQGLIEWAQVQCAELDHELDPFTQIPGYAAWVAHCIHCGRSVTVCLDALEGKEAVDGEAMRIPCPGSEGEARR
jgi:hypothetical protein